MRTSSRILFSGLAMFVWGVSEAYASVHPPIAHTNGNHFDVEKRYIRNADYQSSGDSPKSVYEGSGSSAPASSTESAPPHEQQVSGSPSNTKERRSSLGLPGLPRPPTQAASSNLAKGDLRLMNSVALNDQTDIPFCDQIVELVPGGGRAFRGLEDPEGKIMKRGATRIHARGQPACIRRMIPIGTKGSGGYGKFLSRRAIGDEPQRDRRTDSIEYTHGPVEIHQVRERRTPAPMFLDKLHFARGLVKHDTPDASSLAPDSDMAEAPRSGTAPVLGSFAGHPRAFPIERPTIRTTYTTQNNKNRRWTLQRDRTTSHALNKPGHDERAESHRDGQGA